METIDIKSTAQIIRKKIHSFGLELLLDIIIAMGAVVCRREMEIQAAAKFCSLGVVGTYLEKLADLSQA